MPGSEREVKVELKMPESLFDCYETAYISRIHFEVKSRVQNQQVVTGQIAALNYLTEEVRKAKVCCEGTSNLKSECVTCAWTEEAAVAFLQVEGFDQVAEIETNGQILSEPDCVCESEPVDNYQQSCVGTNCVEKQVGVGDFEIYQNTYSIDTLYQELRRIASYFDSLGIAFYAGITDNRMFCAEGGSTAFKSQTGNKDMVHFQTQYDAVQVAFWFHIGVQDDQAILFSKIKLDEEFLLNLSNEEIDDVTLEGVEICGITAPNEMELTGDTIAFTEYRYTHNPPSVVAPDMEHGTDGNPEDIVNWWCCGQYLRPNTTISDLTLDFSSLIGRYTSGNYSDIGGAMLLSFYYGGLEDDLFRSKALNREIIKTNEVQFKRKRFAKYFESNILPEILSNNLQSHQIEDYPKPISDLEYRLTFGEKEYYLQGPLILINDISQIIYYLADFEIDQNSNWQAIIQVQVIDHFGLEDEDPIKKLFDLIPYQCLDCGFAAWWILQHKYNYKPFRTLIEYEICLTGQL